MTSNAAQAEHWSFVGGHPCLDFANTADWHASERPIELLGSYTGLLAWCRADGLLDGEAVGALERSAAEHPDEAARVYERARELREAIYRLFRAHASGQAVAADDLAALNQEVERALPQLRLAPAEVGFAWTWSNARALDAPLWPIARSAAELLTSTDLARVRECAGHPCGWLFLDTSRNRSRRWCSMESCGNRAKARRHYDRSRGQGPGVRDQEFDPARLTGDP
jgi:predicted RNA-binding Zn ribbon-like protein